MPHRLGTGRGPDTPASRSAVLRACHGGFIGANRPCESGGAGLKRLADGHGGDGNAQSTQGRGAGRPTGRRSIEALRCAEAAGNMTYSDLVRQGHS